MHTFIIMHAFITFICSHNYYVYLHRTREILFVEKHVSIYRLLFCGDSTLAWAFFSGGEVFHTPLMSAYSLIPYFGEFRRKETSRPSQVNHSRWRVITHRRPKAFSSLITMLNMRVSTKRWAINSRRAHSQRATGGSDKEWHCCNPDQGKGQTISPDVLINSQESQRDWNTNNDLYFNLMVRQKQK